MSKLFALFIFFLISFFGFPSNASISKSFPVAVIPTATRTPIYCPPPVIALEKTLLTPSCSNAVSSGSLPDDGLSTRVRLTAVDPKGGALNYNYTVSGGRIIGEGAEVSWDLTGAAPGTYRITVEIAAESGTQLQTETKTITVKECDNDGDRCLGACPQLSVAAPTSPVTAGETMTFTANVSGGFDVENVIYDWTISDGEIIEGQGTPVIRVATNPKMAGKVVKATANFKWDSECWEICNNTAAASGLVAAKKRGDK